MLGKISANFRTCYHSSNSSQAALDKVFDEYDHIKSWMERCKKEIDDFEAINGPGAGYFGNWVKSALAKLE